VEARLADGGGITTAMAPGRSCPPHYGYSPRVFARTPDLTADAVYVIGGLYGNAFALDAIERMAAAERVAPRLIFNGDFHWFDADAAAYAEIQARVVGNAQHVALRGNVETEIATDDAAAGCGCAYPESVPDDDVERSNTILARLRAVAAAVGETGVLDRQPLGGLPMHQVVAVNGARIAVVHGDAWSLAGWRFAHDALHAPEHEAMLASAFALGAVDVFACSHTCAPALKTLTTARGEGYVINNGAAGMANFAGSTFGVITRIATRALPATLEQQRLYGVLAHGVWIDALKVAFDFDGWLARFDALWPAGSAAAISYRHRITQGPQFTVEAALGRAPAASCA
jgi:predicted phosphodiesterase